MSSQALQQVWLSARPVLKNTASSLTRNLTHSRRILRVAKLDSLLLDEQLAQLLQEPISKALSLISASFRASFEPELALLIQLTLYKLSIWNTGASYGSKLQDLRYQAPSSSTTSRGPSGLPKRILFLHASLTLILPYFHARFRSHALSRAWPDAPSLDRRRKVWEYLSTLESLHAFFGLVNFVAFLWNGKYRTLVDRLLKMRLVPSRRLTKRDVSYEFMNRQMVWHAFTEFLLFFLPLVNARIVRRRLTRLTAYLSPNVLISIFSTKCLAAIGTNAPSNQKQLTPPRRGKYWSLSEDQCAICFEDASFNLDMSRPNNIFTSLATPAPASENDIPVYQIYTPYVTSCGHIYCYSCIAGRMLNVAEEEGEEARWECLRCSQPVIGASRYVVEINQSDASGSDYEFSSDMDMDVTDFSGSMGSYSESGLSE